MSMTWLFRRRAALCVSTSLVSLMLGAAAAVAQTTDIGSVDVKSSGGSNGGLPPLSSDSAVGSKAPPGSAPALAPSQGSLNATQPGSIISDKVIRDIMPTNSDYDAAAKYTPGFVSNNPNGFLGDSVGGWRGFQDGQFNITFDGIPFGDADDPAHHSAAYFPSAFLGSITIDRGPGAASQVGYATFGGTMGLHSIDLSNKFSTNLESSFGSYGTMNNILTMQTGQIGDTGVRALLQYSHANTDGALQYGNVNQDQWLAKIEKQAGDFKLTLFSTFGQDQYNNVVGPGAAGITWNQLQMYGKSYGAVNSNPRSQQFYGYNNSQKQTDMEYLGLEGNIQDWHIDNKLYTFAYVYPEWQRNSVDQTIEGNASVANGGTLTSVGVPQPNGTKIHVPIPGVTNGDVTGYLKYNNYRSYGDIFKASRDIDAGIASGTLRFGAWWEYTGDGRGQQYIDYTTGALYGTNLGAPTNAAFKTLMKTYYTNYQPFVEYEWRPTDRLTITPGYKFVSFTRTLDAASAPTIQAPIDYTKTYTANLPYLSARYKVTPEVTVYAQASKGFLVPTIAALYVFNPALSNTQPQSTTNYQAGFVYKSERITADADIYRIDANNFPVVNTLTTGEQYYTNGGTARYQGIEAEGTYAVSKGLALTASAALMDSKYVSGTFKGLRVGDAPNYTASGGVIYDDGLVFGSLMQNFTGGYYGYNGQRATTATTNGSLNYVPGYNTTDFVIGVRGNALAQLGLHAGTSTLIKLGIYNILDHRSTVEINGDPTGVTSVNNNTLLYSFLPGRLILGTVGITF